MASQQPMVDPMLMVPSGSRVVIVVSSGPSPTPPQAFVDVPEVLGALQGQALGALQEAGLSARVFNDYSDSYARGHVMGQLPAAGGGAPVGNEVVLMVSSGQAVSHTKSEMLPEVVGKSEAAAVTALQAASFSPQVVREYSATVPAGTVISQLPNRASLAIRPAKRSNWWVWVATAAVFIGLALMIFFLFRPSEVTVPNVVGRTQAEATQILTDAGLAVGSIDQTVTADVAEGNVTSQTPAPGVTAREGDAVDLEVVGAEALVTVPDVRDMNQADATKTLGDAGFKVAVTRAPSSIVDKGLVIEQTPVAGQRVPRGTTIGIVVSEGQQVENVTIPEVTGILQADAENTLTDAGLKVVVAESPSADVSEGTVISQLPAAGESVAPGTTVGIVVSTGPPTSADQVEVPNVVGLTLAEAQQVVSDAALDAIPVASTGSGQPANQVVAQTPTAGTQVANGSSVVLFYSTGP